MPPHGQDFLPGLGVPEADDLVAAGGDKPGLSDPAPGERVDHLHSAAHLTDQPAVVGVPEADGLVRAGGREVLAIFPHERETVNHSSVGGPLAERAAGPGVPESDDAIATDGGEPAAVGAVGDPEDGPGMGVEDMRGTCRPSGSRAGPCRRPRRTQADLPAGGRRAAFSHRPSVAYELPEVYSGLRRDRAG